MIATAMSVLFLAVMAAHATAETRAEGSAGPIRVGRAFMVAPPARSNAGGTLDVLLARRGADGSVSAITRATSGRRVMFGSQIFAEVHGGVALQAGTTDNHICQIACDEAGAVMAQVDVPPGSQVLVGIEGALSVRVPRGWKITALQGRYMAFSNHPVARASSRATGDVSISAAEALSLHTAARPAAVYASLPCGTVGADGSATVRFSGPGFNVPMSCADNTVAMARTTRTGQVRLSGEVTAVNTLGTFTRLAVLELS